MIYSDLSLRAGVIRNQGRNRRADEINREREALRLLITEMEKRLIPKKQRPRNFLGLDIEKAQTTHICAFCFSSTLSLNLNNQNSSRYDEDRNYCC